MNRRLPPFASLVAFDAVVRHRSFTRAADELSVTQSAISHQIKRLEDFFGIKLLRRLHPGIELSPDGAKLHGEVVPLLDGMAGLESILHRQRPAQTLRVGAGSSLATWWLVRRLRLFRTLHPGIEIDFVPVESTSVDVPLLDFRFIWVTHEEARPTSMQMPLFQEQVFPVCSPSLLPDGQPLSDPTKLLDLQLIQKTHMPMGEWNWSFWFEKLGLKHAAQRGLVLGDIGLCLTSAVEGAGVAIGRSLLVADAVKDGRLVPLLSDMPEVFSPKIYVARWTPNLARDRNIQTLVEWLVRTAEETNRSVLDKLASNNSGVGLLSSDSSESGAHVRCDGFHADRPAERSR